MYIYYIGIFTRIVNSNGGKTFNHPFFLGDNLMRGHCPDEYFYAICITYILIAQGDEISEDK